MCKGHLGSQYSILFEPHTRREKHYIYLEIHQTAPPRQNGHLDSVLKKIITVGPSSYKSTQLHVNLIDPIILVTICNVFRDRINIYLYVHQ